MNGWQIAFIFLTFVDLFGEAYLDGEPKKGEYNFDFSLISWAIIYFILYQGGFFK